MIGLLANMGILRSEKFVPFCILCIAYSLALIDLHLVLELPRKVMSDASRSYTRPSFSNLQLFESEAFWSSNTSFHNFFAINSLGHSVSFTSESSRAT